tara:strand:- start:21787 stop:22299 length:513 start_codon:yes stop_codon:yes gene_type:complete
VTSELAFIDFEASSKDLISSYPVEVGYCLQTGESHGWLIQPAALWSDWSEEAADIHGITRERLMDEGVEARTVAGYLNEVLPSRVYCDALSFDSFWLHRLFRAAHVRANFTLESIGNLLPPDLLDKWSETRDSVFIEQGLARHRAASDARVLYLTWLRLTGGPNGPRLSL